MSDLTIETCWKIIYACREKPFYELKLNQIVIKFILSRYKKNPQIWSKSLTNFRAYGRYENKLFRGEWFVDIQLTSSRLLFLILMNMCFVTCCVVKHVLFRHCVTMKMTIQRVCTKPHALRTDKSDIGGRSLDFDKSRLVRAARETSKFHNWLLLTNTLRCYMAEILPIQCKTLSNQSINPWGDGLWGRWFDIRF